MTAKQKLGFTLIEMLIVIVIIGILAAALVPRLQAVQSRSRNTKRKVDIQNIANGVNIYYADKVQFPLHLNLLLSGIMTTVPQDPMAATNEPCGYIHSNFTAYYQTSGFYDYYGGTPYTGITYNGYMYLKTNSLKYSLIGAKMENDGSVNSYANVGFSNGIGYACGYILQNDVENNGATMRTASAGLINTLTNGVLTEKGKLYGILIKQ